MWYTQAQMKQKRIKKKISRIHEAGYSTVKLCIKFLLWNDSAKKERST
jgi:hypothetical protein